MGLSFSAANHLSPPPPTVHACLQEETPSGDAQGKVSEKASTVSWTSCGGGGVLDPREEPASSQLHLSPRSLSFSVTAHIYLWPASLSRLCASLSPHRSLFPPVSLRHCWDSATFVGVLTYSCCHLLPSPKIPSLENRGRSHSPAVPGNKMLVDGLLVAFSMCNTPLVQFAFLKYALTLQQKLLCPF